MELKEQIEQLEKDFNNRIQELKQQINKPKIEVGKPNLITHIGGCELLIFVESFNDKGIIGYGFAESGHFYGKGESWFTTNMHSIKSSRLATPEEWTTALKKYCDELYKDCDRVDRSGLDLHWTSIDKFNPNINPYLNIDGAFHYKGLFVMDKHGKFAKGLKKELDYDVEMINCTLTYNPMAKYIADGKYKLVRVD